MKINTSLYYIFFIRDTTKASNKPFVCKKRSVQVNTIIIAHRFNPSIHLSLDVHRNVLLFVKKTFQSVPSHCIVGVCLYSLTRGKISKQQRSDDSVALI